MLDDVPSGIKRCVVIEEAYPERGQGADAAPRAAIRAAHLKKALEAHFRESGGEMIGPVALSRQFAREGRESSLQEVAEALSGGINIFAVPVNEIHGYIERIVCITLVPEAILKNNRRSEEHTSELQSLMRISYADFCLKKK